MDLNETIAEWLGAVSDARKEEAEALAGFEWVEADTRYLNFVEEAVASVPDAMIRMTRSNDALADSLRGAASGFTPAQTLMVDARLACRTLKGASDILEPLRIARSALPVLMAKVAVREAAGTHTEWVFVMKERLAALQKGLDEELKVAEDLRGEAMNILREGMATWLADQGRA